VGESFSYSRTLAPDHDGSTWPAPKYSTSEVSPSTNPGRSDSALNPSSTTAGAAAGRSVEPIAAAVAAAACLASGDHCRSATLAGLPPALVPGGTTGGRSPGLSAASGRTAAGIGRAAGAPPCVTCGTGGSAWAAATSIGARNDAANVETSNSLLIRARLNRLLAGIARTSPAKGQLLRWFLAPFQRMTMVPFPEFGAPAPPKSP
jgi:hypothetical protein